MAMPPSNNQPEMSKIHLLQPLSRARVRFRPNKTNLLRQMRLLIRFPPLLLWSLVKKARKNRKRKIPSSSKKAISKTFKNSLKYILRILKLQRFK